MKATRVPLDPFWVTLALVVALRRGWRIGKRGKREGWGICKTVAASWRIDPAFEFTEVQHQK